MSSLDLTYLARFASACRDGLASLSTSPGSIFEGFPRASCGPASELVGRALKERLGIEGTYVCAVGHATLAEGQSHAWFESEGQIIDVTHDQFPGTNIEGWVLPLSHPWHAQFAHFDRRAGFCMPSGWPYYPHDGYSAICAELDRLEASPQRHR